MSKSRAITSVFSFYGDAEEPDEAGRREFRTGQIPVTLRVPDGKSIAIKRNTMVGRAAVLAFFGFLPHI